MQVRLLGPLDVLVDGVAQPVSGLRRRAVLAVLGLTAGEVVSTDRLIDVVWDGHPPATHMNTLQSNISYLRGVLGGRRSIVARPPGYVLDLGGEATDLHVADRLIAQARRSGDPAEQARWLGEALALWRGRPLEDVAGLSWLDSQATRLSQMRMEAVHAFHEARLILGGHAELIAELESLTREYPYHEGVYRRLMLALYRCGRQADALAAYQRLRRRLADDLGVDPGGELRELEAAILRQDTSLDPPAARSGRLEGNTYAPHAPAAAAGPAEAPPRQLPADLGGFVGRVDQLAALDGLLAAAGASAAVTIAAISGTAGVGKTTLGVHWAHRVVDRFPDGQLYVNLRGFDPAGSPMDPAEALRGFLDALAVPGHRVPAGLDARAALFRSLTADRRMLVLLDNARDAEQIRPLLPGTPTCMVLVTSRDQLRGLVATGGARPLVLDLLSVDEARELLHRRIGADRLAAQPAAADEIIRGSSRLPLALAVVAARLATHPQVPLPALAAELYDIRGALRTLHTMAGGEPAADLRAVFSWSYQQLSPDAARMFRLLGLHPGPDVTAPAAASLAGVHPSRVPPALAELTRANLLVEHTAGRFTFHNLLRAYAHEQCERVESAQQRDEAAQRILDHYVHTAYAGNRLLHPHRDAAPLARAQPGVTPEPAVTEAQVQAWFSAERPVLLAAVEYANAHGFDIHAWQLAWALATFVNLRGHWYDYATTGRAALVAAQRLGDATLQARAHRHLAGACLELDQLDDAHEHLQQALELNVRAGDRSAQAHSLLLRSRVWERQGGYAEALELARQALALYRLDGHRRGEADALNAVGWFQALRGDHRLALEACGLALGVLQELDDRDGQAATWDSLGYARHHLGDHAEAVRCYERSAALYQQIGDRSGEATTRTRLGDVLVDAGDHAAARASWERALALIETLDRPEADEVRGKLAALRPQTRRP